MNDAQLAELLRRADPAATLDRDPDGPSGQHIRDEALRRAYGTATAEDQPRLAALGRALTPRTRRRRILSSRPVLVIAAVLVLAAVSLAVVPDLLSQGPRAYAIKELPNGLIVVDFSADSFSPNADAIAADLRQYGVDVQITTVPASPSAVGGVTATFPGEGSSGPPPGLMVGKAGSPDAFTWRIDPVVFHGPVTLQVAVPPADGQLYVVREEVFEPGEVLAGLQCALGEPLGATEVALRLPALGLTGVWSVIDPASVTADGYYETRVDHVPDGTILWGYALDKHTVEFTVAPAGTPLDRFPSPHLSDVPCTPEQAAPWK